MTDQTGPAIEMLDAYKGYLMEGKDGAIATNADVSMQHLAHGCCPPDVVLAKLRIDMHKEQVLVDPIYRDAMAEYYQRQHDVVNTAWLRDPDRPAGLLAIAQLYSKAVTDLRAADDATVAAATAAHSWPDFLKTKEQRS